MSSIYTLIPQVMAEIGAISKDRKNTHQGYSFRGIEDMYAHIQPALIKHGVFCAPEVLESTTESFESTNQQGGKKLSFRILLRVRHLFYAPDGSCVSVTTQGEGIDTSDKASNKAMSAAMKYAFIELFSIPTEGVEDSDRETPEVPAEDKPKPERGPAIAPRSAAPKVAPPPPQPLRSAPANPFHEETPSLFCQGCNGPLRLTTKRDAYGCPNYKAPGVKHSYILVSDLNAPDFGEPGAAG